MYNFEILKLAFNIFTGTGPPYFQDYHNDNDDNIMRTRNGIYLQSCSRNMNRSFKHISKQLWLNIPIETQSNNCRYSFKISILNFYLQKQSADSLPVLDEDCCDSSFYL